MNKQIETIKKYFAIWLLKDQSALENIFAPSIHYLECYGAEYVGLIEIRQWMTHKFEVQTVTQWNIKNIYHEGSRFTVEWFFACVDHGKEFKFDGVSLITFEGEYISEIKEFESKSEHYRPYSK
ncbi:nuclear transport factor 2 family protein [Pediococcus pentosaceus]|uniref:nuclear transport factor 2 family protein n=1 Tax=Pediococcus pentosaceus TaxID=1255 RepID=UPI0018FEB12B|nr:nuclear transport factor 2 family protein [Pediococcus pentosaceus]MBF7122672.1 nuclear transport factor 2 family protein [Pediococcus pentosaceus]